MRAPTVWDPARGLWEPQGEMSVQISSCGFVCVFLRPSRSVSSSGPSRRWRRCSLIPGHVRLPLPLLPQLSREARVGAGGWALMVGA